LAFEYELPIAAVALREQKLIEKTPLHLNKTLPGPDLTAASLEPDGA
jgi:hypothetical protein